MEDVCKLNWRKTSLSDLEMLQECASNNDFFANNYGAVNSVLYEKKFNSHIAIENGWFFEKYSDNGKTIYSFPHKIDSDKSGIKAAIEMLCGSEKNGDESFTFQNITADEKDILSELFPNARITSTPESGDYIYLTKNLAGLEGKKYSKKRNHIHQFQNKYSDFKFELLNESNFDSVRTVEEKWLNENSDYAISDGTLADLETEKEIIFYALDNFEAFSKTCGMSGGILFVSGEPVAFCISSLLSKSVTDIHFEKCLSPFARDGGYAIINNEFAKTVDTEFINREEDLGIEGLRKAKLSYYPERVIEKFTVEIKS
ncbi:MAG: DUF2156 domain-containing protein [Treponema sp.]|nr:DUF2156 domain-containing protein [Treponema sp.]